ncbi:MAG: transcription termination factor NusA [Candidatus Paceibacterota bacterium]|jgi:N utilization substance protein A
MLDVKILVKAAEQLASEKDLDVSLVLEAIEAALASAYKKEYNKKGEIIKCVVDKKKGDVDFFQVKTVVDNDSVRFDGESEETIQPQEGEEMIPLYNPERHLMIDEAKKVKSDVQVGDEILFDLEAPSSEFGRIAAQTAKQVVLQKLREIEKDSVKKEFEGKVGNLVNGLVQRVERGNVFIDMGKASGVMFFSESIPGEHYRLGEKLKFYLLSVQENTRGPGLILSRSHPKFVSKLFEIEVPEIADGIVQIKGIVREAGSRTKIAVTSTADGVDPVGACVGQRGARVMAVNNELGNEKLDIIEWSENAEKFIASAISPADVSSVELISQREALVLVPDDQLSLAIGRGGQNVRLAAKLTGWKIDVRSQSKPEEVLEGGTADIEEEKNEESDKKEEEE